MVEKRVACRVLVGKPECTRQLGKPRHGWEDNIKKNILDVGWGHGLDQPASE
jgi:hypothetical protein